ncbi:MAG: acetyl-CoA C-acyltransferase, partial [Thermoleophilia bacterium]
GMDHLPGATINRFCASSVQTTRMAYHAIKAGEGDVFVSGGVECVSQYINWAGAGGAEEGVRNPLFDDATARGVEMATTNATWTDPRDQGSLPDVYIAMGQTAENVATSLGISRERQDEWGVTSQNRAEKAIANGFFEREITPVTMPDGRVVATDDGPRPGVTLEGVRALNPVFRENGTITAGNCCPLNDGAAAVVVMSDTKAAELGLTPLARIVATGVTALSPEIMGLGPIEASKQALARAGMTIGDMDLYEINEAFSVVALAVNKLAGLDAKKVNVRGGAVALGHPIGASGARILTTLLYEMMDLNQKRGLATLCIGGGEALALVVER